MRIGAASIHAFIADVKNTVTDDVVKETETDKNGLYRIVWRCSYSSELGTRPGFHPGKKINNVSFYIKCSFLFQSGN